MRLPFTLSLYIGKQFLTSIALALMGMIVIVALGDLVELIRRTADVKVGFGTVLGMLFLKVPDTAMRILPFAIMIGGMVALTRMTRTQELVVVRAAGVSVWQFLMPALLITFLLGVFFVTVFNPVAAVMLSRFEQLEAKYISGKTSLLAVSSSGLWIKQVEHDGGGIKEHIFHAMRVENEGARLSEVIIFNMGEGSRFIGRMDAGNAVLEKGKWHLHDVIMSTSGALPAHQDDLWLNTDLTIGQIQDSFASPVTLSFWQLPGFIHTLEKAGFSALHHRMYWQAMLASPFLLCAMILVAAVFSLRLPRRGGVMALVIAGVITGFMVHFLSNLIYAFGQSGEIPVILSAWSPAMIVLMVSSGLLLHFEDG